MSSFQQMPLALKPPRRPSFTNFIVGANQTLVSTLQFGLEADQWVLLMGPHGGGKSHLMTATFDEQLKHQDQVVFVPLADPSRWPLLDALEAPTIIIDDIDALAGHEVGEMALFNGLNRWRSQRTMVLMSATSLSDFVLPDLGSRLGQATRLSLRPLDDVGLQSLVERLVSEQDMSLPGEVAQYLITRSTRNAGELTQLTNDLMRQAMSERRAITKPMVKALLDSL